MKTIEYWVRAAEEALGPIMLEEVVKGIRLEAMEECSRAASPLKCWPECKSEFCEGRNSSRESILLEISKVKGPE